MRQLLALLSENDGRADERGHVVGAVHAWHSFHLHVG